MKKLFSVKLLALLMALLFVLTGCITPATNGDSNTPTDDPIDNTGTENQNPDQSFDLSSLPSYAGEPYVALNGNIPSFTEDQYTTVSYERYSELDSLGRCGVAIACIGLDLMPTEDRGDISSVKPTGWIQAQYNGQYLYNRCHIIGFQLSGENDNEKNLITGTRYFNVDGMLPFENMVADYVRETGNHVLFRVTPIYDGDNLLASGVQMEAYSIEDSGAEICFNVYVYNVQPGIAIDYATGRSWLDTEAPPAESEGTARDYVLNTSTKSFHYPHCGSVDSMKPANRQDVTDTRENLSAQNYKPCGNCNP